MRESRWIPWAIGGFFSVFLLAAIALAVIAARSCDVSVCPSRERRRPIVRWTGCWSTVELMNEG